MERHLLTLSRCGYSLKGPSQSCAPGKGVGKEKRSGKGRGVFAAGEREV